MQAFPVVLCFVPGVLYALTHSTPHYGMSACWLLQVGEARAHSLPLGQQPQQLHRDSSAGTPDVPAASLLPPHDGRKPPHGAHGSSTAAAGGGSSSSSSADKGGGGSPWVQRTRSEQQPRLHLPSEHGSAVAAAATSGVGSRAAAKGAGLLDPGGGGDDESHHVVMSSGALLHHLGANSHQRSSAD